MTLSTRNDLVQDSSGLPPKVQSLETAVFLFLLLPVLAFSWFEERLFADLGFVLGSIQTIVRDLALVSLILFLLWRNREPFDRIGWTRRRLLREAALGVLLYVFFLGGSLLMSFGLGRVAPGPPAAAIPWFLTARAWAEMPLALALLLVVAWSEETIYRGYLLYRFTGLTSRPATAVLLSSVLFGLGHGYQGLTGTGILCLMGIVLAIVYLWRRSLVAPFVMHFLHNLVKILLPLVIAR
jgi:uncharacterized protein